MTVSAARRKTADTIGRRLAHSLGQDGITQNGREFTVPAYLAPPARYKRSGNPHHVTLAEDGSLLCRCEAAAFNRECWAITEVRKAFHMTTTTEKGTALVPLEMRRPISIIPTESELTRMGKVAGIILAGGVDLPKELNTPEKVMAVMLKGRALGLDPTIAIEHIHYIDGHAVPDAQIMAGMLARDIPDSKLLLMDEDPEVSCTMRVVLPGRGIDASYTVSVEDADVKMLIKRDTPHEARGRDGNYMTKPGGWVMYPRDRLRWHATKRLLKIYAPDVINGMASFGFEYDERNEPETIVVEGHVVNRTSGEIAAPPPPDDENEEETPPAGEEREQPPREKAGFEQTTAISDFIAVITARRQGDGMARLNVLQARFKEAFAYAVIGGRPNFRELTPADASTFIGWLREAAGEAPGEAAPPDDQPPFE